MVEAIVEFDYAAQEPDELTLQKGDVITEIDRRSGGWWEGKLKGKKGMFPDNFVKVVGAGGDSPTGTVTHRKSKGRKCKVLFSYAPVNDDELKLEVDEVIEIHEEVEEGWWKGQLNNQIGVFPSNFVKELTDGELPDAAGETVIIPPVASKKNLKSSGENVSKPNEVLNHSEQKIHSSPKSPSNNTDSEVPVLPPKPVKEMCKVLFPYKALNEDELSLQEGDLITLICKDGQDKGWWKGELRGQIGVFPDNFVQVLAPEEVVKPSRPPSKSAVTTNRVRDTITKPVFSAAPGIPPTSSTNAIPNISQAKTLETPPKLDEKTSPPGISRKPTLPPPPIKKPHRSPSGSSKQITSSTTAPETAASKQVESPTTNLNASRSSSVSPATPKQLGLVHDSKPTTILKVEAIDGTDGSCLSVSSSGSYSLNHHNDHTSSNDVNKNDIDLDCIGRTAMLTHPTASRVRAPRRRPPSSICNKEENPSSEMNSVSIMNGNVDSHVENKGCGTSMTWVEELKMSYAKKQSIQGRKRVMIGPGSGGGGGGGDSSTSPEPAPSPLAVLKPSVVVLRNNNSGSSSHLTQRPQSMFGGTEKISPNARPFPVLGTPSSDSITVTSKQWNELNEKVSRLESTVETQQNMFTKAIKELTNKLNEETERVLQMQLEIEKLTDLVTQV